MSAHESIIFPVAHLWEKTWTSSKAAPCVRLQKKVLGQRKAAQREPSNTQTVYSWRSTTSIKNPQPHAYRRTYLQANLAKQQRQDSKQRRHRHYALKPPPPTALSHNSLEALLDHTRRQRITLLCALSIRDAHVMQPGLQSIARLQLCCAAVHGNELPEIELTKFEAEQTFFLVFPWMVICTGNNKNQNKDAWISTASMCTNLCYSHLHTVHLFTNHYLPITGMFWSCARRQLRGQYVSHALMPGPGSKSHTICRD
jgi:hypothetical protein